VSASRPIHATRIDLSATELAELERIAACRIGEARKVERSRAILSLASGTSVSATAVALSIDRRTVREAARRYLELREQLPEGPIKRWLDDRARIGRPDTFDAFLWTDVLALVTSDPKSHGYEETQWSAQLLATHLVETGRVERIDRTSVSRFFAKADIKPHRVRQWLNRPEDSEFDTRAAHIKGLLAGASPPLAAKDRKKKPERFSEPAPNLVSLRRMRRMRGERALVSFDEKPGMQAKERIAPTLSVAPGQIARQEFEYKRHGTRVLLALIIVQTGVVLGRVLARRTNVNTARVLDELLRKLWTLGYKGADIIVDQLNTHWSLDVIRVVARHCSIPMPSEAEIAKGRQRRDWLEQTKSRKVVFHFVPKHSSWLNPIEIWFSVLGRKVLRRGSFTSTDDLTASVQRFVDYYNERLARPYRFRKYQLHAAAA
jgi:transposase